MAPASNAAGEPAPTTPVAKGFGAAILGKDQQQQQVICSSPSSEDSKSASGSSSASDSPPAAANKGKAAAAAAPAGAGGAGNANPRPPAPPAVPEDRNVSPEPRRRQAGSRRGPPPRSPATGLAARSRSPLRNGGHQGGGYTSRWDQRGPRAGAAAPRACWWGRDCSKAQCWFSHPDGRRVDEEGRHKMRGTRGGDRWQGPGRRAGGWRPNRDGRQGRANSSRSPGGGGRAPSPRPAARWQTPPKSKSRSPSTSPSRPKSKSPAAAASPSPSRSRSRASAAEAAENGGRGLRKVGRKDSEPSSFRDFVLKKLDNAATPEEAQRKFGEHLRLLAERGLQRLRGTGLLLDMYGSLSAIRLYDMRLHTAQLSAEAFVRDLRSGRFEALSLAAPAVGDAAGAEAAKVEAATDEAPHFAQDADANALLFSGLPVSASVWDIHDLALQCAGFAGIAWSKPAGPDLTREVRVKFETLEQATAAMGTLAAAKLPSGLPLHPSLLPAATSLSGLRVPPEMSHPERIRKDQELSAQIVRRLDALLGLPAEATEAVLGHAGPAAAKLDLQVLYLRRVHRFCFYAGAWCRDEWELRDRCGALLVRGGEPSNDAPAEGDWSRRHEERLSRFLATASLPRPLPAGCPGEGEGDGEAERRCEALCAARTRQLGEGRFQCELCNKLFKGAEYVGKHLRKLHADIFERVHQELHEEAAAAAFLADPDRPNALLLRMALT